MKKIILLICASFFSTICAFSQTVNGIPLKELPFYGEYIRIIQRPIVFNQKIKINIEYGQDEKNKNTEVIGADGSPMEFNSIIQVLNLLSKYGYELINANDTSGTSFIMRTKENTAEK